MVAELPEEEPATIEIIDLEMKDEEPVPVPSQSQPLDRASDISSDSNDISEEMKEL